MTMRFSLIAILAATAATSAGAANAPEVGDTITLQNQTLVCFDLENAKQLELTRAKDGPVAALDFINRHALPDNPTQGAGMFANVCSRFGPGGTMYLVKKIYHPTSDGPPLFCIDAMTKWNLNPPSEKKDQPAELPGECWWGRLDY